DLLGAALGGGNRKSEHAQASQQHGDAGEDGESLAFAQQRQMQIGDIAVHESALDGAGGTAAVPGGVYRGQGGGNVIALQLDMQQCVVRTTAGAEAVGGGVNLVF